VPERRDGAARLYVEYRERIYRFCLSRLRSREEAEDAVQNVFLRVHTALDRGVVPEYEAAWLYKIAHNVCLSRIDHNVRHGAEELHSFDDEDVQVAAPEVSRDELAGLNEALEAMPHNLRTALLLREWQGLSYAEIAEAMGLSVSAVETLIFRGRRHLAAALEQGTPTPRKKVVARVADLLGLGWLRNVVFGAGGAAKLAAGAALLSLAGGGAAVAITDAHSRPAPAKPTPTALVVSHTPAIPATSRTGHNSTRVSDTRGVRHQVSRVVVPPTPRTTTTTAAVAPAPAAAPAPTVVTEPAPAAPAPSQPPATTAAAKVQPVPSVPSVPTASTPVPTASVPSVTVPTASVPSVSVPTVSVPAVSVPAVSVPVTLP